MRLRQQLSALERYYSRYGVSFFTRHPSIELPFETALVTDPDALIEQVWFETGVYLGTDGLDTLGEALQTRVRDAFGRAALHNLRQLVKVYGESGVDEVNVVVFEELAARELPPGLESLGALLGIGFSPGSLHEDSGTSPLSTLRTWLELPTEFTPFAIVGAGPIERSLAHPDPAIAHELGHARGLAHSEEAGNLMNPAELDCAAELSTIQLRRLMRGGRGPWPSAELEQDTTSSARE